MRGSVASVMLSDQIPKFTETVAEQASVPRKRSECLLNKAKSLCSRHAWLVSSGLQSSIAHCNGESIFGMHKQVNKTRPLALLPYPRWYRIRFSSRRVDIKRKQPNLSRKPWIRLCTFRNVHFLWLLFPILLDCFLEAPRATRTLTSTLVACLLYPIVKHRN